MNAMVPLVRQAGASLRRLHRRDGIVLVAYSATGLAIVPQAARIIAVADAWDALTTDRSYRRALARDEAMAELAPVAGTQLDPRVVAALGQCVADGASEGSRHE